MSRPLQSADPPRLGPFRLTARLRESPAGIVYLGEDPYGVRVSVALLTRGAAGDAAARDRFRAAIIDELPARPGGPLFRSPAPASRAAAGGEGPAAMAGAAADAPLIAAHPESQAPWVATMHDPHGAGAERFLRPVMFGREGKSGVEKDGASGPHFEPYWIGSREPASPALAPAARRNDRGLIMAIVTLAILLLLLALALAMLFGCQPARPRPVPTPVPSTGSTSPSPAPSPTPKSPSPSPSGTKPTPRPSGTDDGGGAV